MAERQNRRRFTAEFKAEAVKRLLDGGKGLGEVATELGAEPRPAERRGATSTWRRARRRRWPRARPSRPSCSG